jgi:hypothetical protein
MSQIFDAETEMLAVDYVLGELRRDEALAFERRLAAEPALAAEIGRLRRTLGALPFATEAEPPARLRARIVAAAETQAGRPAPARAPRRVVWSRFAAAAAAVLALAFGYDSYRARRELSLQRELAMTLLEPNVVKSFTLAGLGPARSAYGTVALDLDAKKGAVVLKGLPALPVGRVYRLWAKVGERDVPCGDFAVEAGGRVLAQFVVPVESYTAPLGALFVTVEASGEGTAPSGPPVMRSV